MATQALYRQWRPTRFQDVVGQDALVTTLRNQVASGRVSHAYLFCGSRGTGKTTCAKILARAVNCLSPENGDPCGRCAACEALAAENNLDVVEIDAASNNGVDEIRDLREKIKYPPQHGRYRVYVVDEVHMLSAGAFNALLKTLEEPPAHAIFILATTEPRKLPATVLSRCQRYDFRRFPSRVIVDRLTAIAAGERGDVRPDALSLIARAAEGGMRDAIGLLDMCLSYGGGSVDAALVREVLGATDRGFLFAFADHILDGDAKAALSDIDALVRDGREPQVFARDVTDHLRALMLSQSCGDALADLLDTTDEDADRFRAQAKKSSRERLLSLLDLFMNADTDMRWSGQPRVALEAAAVRACLPSAELRLETLAARLDLLEKKLETAAPQSEGGGALSARVELLEKAMQSGMIAPPAPKSNADSAPREAKEQKSAKPEKETPPPVSGEGVWDAALKLLKRDEPGLFAQLRMARFAGVQDDCVRAMFPRANEINMNMLKGGDRPQKIEAALSAASGKQLTLSLELESPPVTNTVRQKSVLQNVFDVFGRENVEVVDE